MLRRGGWTAVRRAVRGEDFDAAYAASLSGDAIPILVSTLPDLDPEDRCLVAARVLDRWSETQGADWRAWSLGRTRARRAVRESRAQLQAWVCELVVELEFRPQEQLRR